MRREFLLASFAVSLLVLTVSFASADAEEAAAPNYYIEGYVADTGRLPMEGVTVSVMDKDGTTFQNETGADGFFSVGATANTGLMISFAAFGHTAITCPNASFQQGSDYFILNLSKATYNSVTRTYTITGPVDDMQCAIMVASEGAVRGQISYGSSGVKNASVTLAPLYGEGIYTANTDDRGNYEIKCPTGTYTLRAGGQGFDRSDIYTVNVTGTPTTVNVVFEKSELKKYLGLDAAHILMLMGVMVSIMLAAAAWFLSKRMSGPHGLEIIDDSAEDDSFSDVSDEL